MKSFKGETILQSTFTKHFAVGLIAFSVFAGCVSQVNADLARLDSHQTEQEKSFPDDEVFDNLTKALQSPEKVRRLIIQNEDFEMKRLPAGLGTLVKLESLELSCLEQLEALPNEIGQLRQLEELIIDNGNGCQMNVSIPRSVGQLQNLRVLRLYGALDPRGISPRSSLGRTKSLPATFANLQNLEELDLGRNGLRSVPPQIASLRQLKKLGLDYNALREIPSFVGNLSTLEELSLNSNGGVRLPQSLSRVKGLRVMMGNNALTLSDQKLLRSRFPNIIFSFENEFDDNAANEETPKPKPRTRGGRRR